MAEREAKKQAKQAKKQKNPTTPATTIITEVEQTTITTKLTTTTTTTAKEKLEAAPKTSPPAPVENGKDAQAGEKTREQIKAEREAKKAAKKAGKSAVDKVEAVTQQMSNLKVADKALETAQAPATVKAQPPVSTEADQVGFPSTPLLVLKLKWFFAYRKSQHSPRPSDGPSRKPSAQPRHKDRPRNPSLAERRPLPSPLPRPARSSSARVCPPAKRPQVARPANVQ